MVGSVHVATPGSVHGKARLRLRLKLGSDGGVVGSVHVATPGSARGTFFELQLGIMPHQHVHIPPRPLLFRRYKSTKKKGEGLDHFTGPHQAQYMA